jgi:hypothetical protein
VKAILEFDPALAEEAVQLALKGSTRRGAFNRERERAYAEADPERRDRAFLEIHSRWFEALRLDQPVRAAIREAGEGLSQVSLWLFVRAVSGRQAGAELFVADKAHRSVVVRILPATLADRGQALEFLRRELLYIADMLDPRFEYEPRLPRSPLGPPADRRLQDRYAALWRASVEGRLARAGGIPAGRREACLAGFRRMFGCLGDDTGACFERIWSGERPLHSVFVALATDPAAAFGVNSAAAEHSRRCPLCGFPTADLEPDAEGLSRGARKEIHRDFPAWEPHHGLCRQCADLYRELEADRPARAAAEVRT